MLRSFQHFSQNATFVGAFVFCIGSSTYGLLASEQILATNDPYVAVNQHDATLRSIFAINGEYVVAVGDRGLVLTSDNGGVSWIHRPSPTTANLYAVEFLNKQRGWIAGGMIQAYSKTSMGVVLATTDGGMTWQVKSSGILPRLTGIAIAADGRLVAHGDYSPHLRSSVFESHDGGTTWQGMDLPIGHSQTMGWSAAGSGLVVDRVGNACFLQTGSTVNSSPAFEPKRPVHTVAHTGKFWLAAGAGGLLFKSFDGKQWDDIPLPLSERALRHCDWLTIALRDNRIWVAGSPGSVIFCSSDFGNTWKVDLNNHRLPKYDIAFADAMRGWAVGPGGSIQATRDGGKSWIVQRTVWQRLAAQAIVSRLENVPWPALISVSWDDRRASASIVAHCERHEESADFRPEQATIAAENASQVGIATFTILPNHPFAHRLASGSDSNRDDRDLVEDLAAAILIWCPDVVITENPSAKQALDRATSAAVHRAIQLAAVPQGEFASSISQLNLGSWRVRKTVSKCDQAEAQYSSLYDSVLRDAGITISDVLLPCGNTDGLDCDVFMRTEASLRMTQAAQSTLLGGVAPASDTHRQLSLKNIGKYQYVMAKAHREASIRRLHQMPELVPNDISSWRTQLEFLIQQLPKRDVGPTLMQVAHESLKRQKWQRWKAALELLAESAPSDDFSRWSQLQLLNLSASDELSTWRRASSLGLSHSSDGTLAPDNSIDISVSTASWTATPFSSSQTGMDSAVELARFEAAIPRLSSLQAPHDEYVAALRSSLGRIRSLADSNSDLGSRPDELLVQQSRLRRFSETTDSPAALPSNLQIVASQSALAGWKQVADQELQLLVGNISALRWVARASRAEQPPHLDGHLDEDFWKRTLPIELTDLDGRRSRAASQIRWAYDEQYLYLAVTCPTAISPAVDFPQGKPQPVAARIPSRQYDMDLESTDHVQILLDTDRDYATAHELGINQRGETFDRTCGLEQWNPKWFVAVQGSDQFWQAEAAIALADLTLMTHVAGRAWAISAYRYTPDSHIQSWSHIKSDRPMLQASGLLLLEP